LSSGLPTIPVRELEIQKREDDLVAATFGRSFYVIDDYTPLRELASRSDEILAMDGYIFPIKPGDMYLRWSPGGAEDYAADNPPFGVTFTYYVRDPLRTRRATPQSEGGRAARAGEDTPYPSWDELEAEDREEAPRVFLTIRDSDGNVVNTVSGSTSQGLRRATWDYRYPGYNPVSAGDGGGGGRFGGGGFGGGRGPMALPGRYTVSLSRRVDGVVTELAPATAFEIAPMGQPAIQPQDRAAVLAFQRETGELLRVVTGTQRAASAAMQQIQAMKRAVGQWPEATEQIREDVRALELRLTDLQATLNGGRTRRARSEPEMPGIVGRVNQVVRGHWNGVYGPTNTHREQYRIAYDQFTTLYPAMQQLIEIDLPAIEAQLEAVGAPWTTGRALPDWPPR
ncbi:MAG: glycosyl hydrolase, partial [Gemmatimonadota bacterium]